MGTRSLISSWDVLLLSKFIIRFVCYTERLELLDSRSLHPPLVSFSFICLYRYLLPDALFLSRPVIHLQHIRVVTRPRLS
jgi:hypothetical protein